MVRKVGNSAKKVNVLRDEPHHDYLPFAIVPVMHVMTFSSVLVGLVAAGCISIFKVHSLLLTYGAFVRAISLPVVCFHIYLHNQRSGFSRQMIFMQILQAGANLLSTVPYEMYRPEDVSGNGLYQACDVATVVIGSVAGYFCRDHKQMSKMDSFVALRCTFLGCVILSVILHGPTNFCSIAWVTGILLDSLSDVPQCRLAHQQKDSFVVCWKYVALHFMQRLSSLLVCMRMELEFVVYGAVLFQCFLLGYYLWVCTSITIAEWQTSWKSNIPIVLTAKKKLTPQKSALAEWQTSWRSKIPIMLQTAKEKLTPQKSAWLAKVQGKQVDSDPPKIHNNSSPGNNVSPEIKSIFSHNDRSDSSRCSKSRSELSRVKSDKDIGNSDKEFENSPEFGTPKNVCPIENGGNSTQEGDKSPEIRREPEVVADAWECRQRRAFSKGAKPPVSKVSAEQPSLPIGLPMAVKPAAGGVHLCRFYASTGACHRSTDCWFSHDPKLCSLWRKEEKEKQRRQEDKETVRNREQDAAIPAYRVIGSPIVADPARSRADSARPSADSARPSADSARPIADPERPIADSTRPIADPERPIADSTRIADHRPVVGKKLALTVWGTLAPVARATGEQPVVNTSNAPQSPMNPKGPKMPPVMQPKSLPAKGVAKCAANPNPALQASRNAMCLAVNFFHRCRIPVKEGFQIFELASDVQKQMAYKHFDPNRSHGDPNALRQFLEEHMDPNDSSHSLSPKSRRYPPMPSRVAPPLPFRNPNMTSNVDDGGGWNDFLIALQNDKTRRQVK